MYSDEIFGYTSSKACPVGLRSIQAPGREPDLRIRSLRSIVTVKQARPLLLVNGVVGESHASRAPSLLGEITDVLREAFRTYEETPVV